MRDEEREGAMKKRLLLRVVSHVATLLIPYRQIPIDPVQISRKLVPLPRSVGPVGAMLLAPEYDIGYGIGRKIVRFRSRAREAAGLGVMESGGQAPLRLLDRHSSEPRDISAYLRYRA